MPSARLLLACFAGLTLGAATSACAEPQLFCEDGVFEQTFQGRGCVFAADHIGASGEESCPPYAQAHALTSDGIICAESDEARAAICGTVGKTRASSCGLSEAIDAQGCIVALTLDSLECDGLTNLCGGGERIEPRGNLTNESSVGCGGSVRFPTLGAPGYDTTRLTADWPAFLMGVGLELEMSMTVTISARPNRRDSGYATIFRQEQSGFTIGLVGSALDPEPRLAVTIGSCGSDSPARAGIDTRPFPLDEAVEIRAGVTPEGDGWIEWGGGPRITTTRLDCAPATVRDPVGFAIGPFPGTIDGLVIHRLGGPLAPPAMPPPLCMPPMMCPPP